MNPFSSETLDAIEYAGELFSKARHAIVLTGAGLSTPSGIPDFRSEGTGLWSRDEPLEVASLVTFRTHPEQFFQWFRPLVGRIFSALPNAAHLALAELEARGRLQAVLTQNIDMLHHKAGSKRVLELHGTLGTVTCTQCYCTYESAGYLAPFIATGSLPYCPACGALLKPDVILFGEQLPQKTVYAAQCEARTCDLVMVIGSSLEVLPVAGLPMQAIDRGAHLIIVNNSPTYLNVRADVVLPQDVSVIIPAIVERVLHD
jgi:NAD-dependent deacetylase